MQLTTVHEFHRYRTDESEEAEQNDQTRPEVHASVWDSAIFKKKRKQKTGGRNKLRESGLTPVSD